MSDHTDHSAGLRGALGILAGRFRSLFRKRVHRTGRIVGTPSAWSVAKLGVESRLNADAFGWRLVNENELHVVLCDGVSRSASPGEWARHVVHQLLQCAPVDVDENQMSSVAHCFKTEQDEPLEWWARAATTRGSSTTFLRLRLAYGNDGQVGARLDSLGDTVVFHCRDGVVINSCPPLSASDFSTMTQSMCSVPEHVRGEITDSEWSLDEGDELLLTTDGIAKFVVAQIERNPRVPIVDLLPFLGFGQLEFADWADEARQSGAVEDDDLTVVHVGV